ncbi:hypothetical protein, partial [Streptococcus suis]|uniref:hypothetical protein n=1 Tax=Streptococcus suis TaxID=1307 RepID=UPI001EE0D0F1
VFKSQEIGKNEGREAFLFCPNSHYSGKKTDYQTNKQKKTNIKRDVCLHSETACRQFSSPT